MNVAVIGSNGQLGSDVVRALTDQGETVWPLTHADVEVSDSESVTNCLRLQGPDIVINCAAMHHVETCEQEPSKAYATNAVGARNLAIATRDLNAVLIHVSTDYVFDGKK